MRKIFDAAGAFVAAVQAADGVEELLVPIILHGNLILIIIMLQIDDTSSAGRSVSTPARLRQTGAPRWRS